MVGGYFEKKPMTNKIKKFLYTLEHLIPDGHDEIPTSTTSRRFQPGEVGTFSVIVKLCVIFGNLRLKLQWGHLPVPGDTTPPAPGAAPQGP